MARPIPDLRVIDPSQPLRAALYGRVSHDPTQQGRSVEAQFRVGEGECDDRGWRIVGRYRDVDRSATRYASRTRERFEDLVADMEAGRVDVVVYAERSRISRDLAVSVMLRDLCERTGVLLCYEGRVYDMRKQADRREFTRDAVQSEEEGESIALRNVRTARLAAREGNPGPGPAPLGYRRRYDPDTGELLGQVIDEATGPVVVRAFDMLLQGASVRSILPVLEEVRPEITINGVISIFRNKSYIGIRTHYEDEYKGQWDALIDEGKFWAAQNILDDPMRRKNHSSGTVHLLTGTYFACSICREKAGKERGRMRGKEVRQKSGTYSMYTCKLEHAGVSRSRADAYVTEAALTWLVSPAARAAFTPVDSDAELHQARARAQQIAEQLAEARRKATEFDDRTGLLLLSIASLGALEQRLIPQLQELEQTIRRLSATGDPLIDRLLDADEDELDDIWNNRLTLEQRRAALMKIVRIELRRAEQQGPASDITQRLRLIFVGEPEFDSWFAPAAAP